MGTRFEIVIRGDLDRHHAQTVGEAAIAEIERLHKLLSFYAPDSLLSHINRNAERAPVRVDADTFELLIDAAFIWHASGGAFDPTRGSGMDAVELDADARTVRFARPGVTLDLGAIAKGHAVDRAAAILREHNVCDAIIHGGTSSIAAIGEWKVAIAPDTSRTITLRDETLSVSSGALRDHIIDPATGAFIRGPRIAAVIGPNATHGDAWSTAIAVTGRRPSALPDFCKTIIIEQTAEQII